MPPKRSTRVRRKPCRLQGDAGTEPKRRRKEVTQTQTDSASNNRTVQEETNNTLLLQNLVQSVASMQRQILELQNSRGQLTVSQSQLSSMEGCRRNLVQDPLPGTSQTLEDQTNISACNDDIVIPTGQVPLNHSLGSGQKQQHDSESEAESQPVLDVLPTVAQNAAEHITGKGSLQAAQSNSNLEHLLPRVDRDLLLTTHIPLSTMVKSSLKADIWANKFIELSLLLTTDQQPSYDLICEPGDFDGTGGPQLKWSQRKSVTIKYINQWTDAFNTYTAVYTERFPEQAPNLMKYMATVRRIAKKRGDWSMYDTKFRKLREIQPHLGWETVHNELYQEARLEITETHRSSFKHVNYGMRRGYPGSRHDGKSSDRSRDFSRNYRYYESNASSNSGQDSGKKQYKNIVTDRQPFRRDSSPCWRYNKGKYCWGCSRPHNCSYCKADHPRRDCPILQSRKDSEPSPSSQNNTNKGKQAGKNAN